MFNMPRLLECDWLDSAKVLINLVLGSLLMHTTADGTISSTGFFSSFDVSYLQVTF